MGNENEQPTPQTLSSSNSSSEAIPSTSQNIPNYMPGYFGPVLTWSPTFLPYPGGNQYPINIQMITHAAGSSKHTEDARAKLLAMIELYRANEEPPSMTQVGSNVDSTANATTVGGVGEVHSPRVVKGKGRLPSMRRASRMEIEMRKAKVKTKKAPTKGKRKERGGGDTQVTEREDAPAVEVCRNLFGSSPMDVSNKQPIGESESNANAIIGTQPQEIMMQSQESMQIGMDGSQPLQ